VLCFLFAIEGIKFDSLEINFHPTTVAALMELFESMKVQSKEVEKNVRKASSNHHFPILKNRTYPTPKNVFLFREGKLLKEEVFSFPYMP
jgi:hypothetical protein